MNTSSDKNEASVGVIGINGAVDSHCHLLYPPMADNVEETLEAARQAGVVQVVDIGCWPTQQERHQTVELASRLFPTVACSVGLHPHDARLFDKELVADIVQLAERQGVVALGETGLDYHYQHSPREEQQRAFRQFIGLSREMELPLIIHTREAEADTLQILREERAHEAKGVVHCFTGTTYLSSAILDMGFHIGLTGVITFRGKNTNPLREVAKEIPDDLLLVETDAPYLSPEPLRGRPNSPAHLVHTIAKLAQLRQQSVEHVVSITARNARALFQLPTVPVSDPDPDPDSIR